MKVLCIQHVPFETPAALGSWFISKGFSMDIFHAYRPGPGADISDYDLLVLMGGPMSVNHESVYPWLTEEKRLIESAMNLNKKVMGICLGAQLIASVCGGRVYPNPEKEIGWHTVSLTAAGISDPVFSALPESFTAFHWHGETFDLPAGAVHTAGSQACANQAFILNNQAMGLQFHLESDHESVSALIKNCSEDLTPGSYVQSPEEITKGGDLHCSKIILSLNSLMNSFI